MVSNYRGIGLSEMIKSINENKKIRCSIDLALHVLEIMDGIIIAATKSSAYVTTTRCEKPTALKEQEIKLLKI